MPSGAGASAATAGALWVPANTAVSASVTISVVIDVFRRMLGASVPWARRARKRLNRTNRHATNPAMLNPTRRSVLHGAAVAAGGLLVESCAHTSAGPALPPHAELPGSLTVKGTRFVK